MGISLNNVMKERKFELANAIAILSLASSVPLTDEMTPEQQNAVLGDKLNTIGASGSAEFLTATTDAILNPSGYTDIVAAVMDLLARVNSSTPGTAQNPKNVLKVSPEGGDYDSISAALNAVNAGLFGTLSEDNTCLIQVYPGQYSASFNLVDFVNIVGMDRDNVILTGAISKNSTAPGMLANMTLRSGISAVLAIYSGGEHILHNLKIENWAGGAALLVNNEDAVVTIENTELVSNSGLALRVFDGKAIARNTNFTGLNGVSVENGSTFVFAGGDIMALNNGIYCDSSSEAVTMFGNIKADGCAVKTEGGVLRLLGGIFAGDVCSISADDFSTVFMGAITVAPDKVQLANAEMMLEASVEGIGFEDTLGLFGHSLDVVKSLKGMLIELGEAKNRHENDIHALHDKSNHNEQDSLVDNAMIQISLMSPEYTMFMIDSFMDTNSNTYPAGDDKALVFAERSILMHQDNAETFNFYKQNFFGDMAGKNKVYLKAALQKGMADSMGAHDWQVDFHLEVIGGRYGTTPVSFLLHSANALNLDDGRIEKELDLSSPVSGIALNPIIAAGELVSMKITIKSDSATVQATPVVRSFVAFV